MFKMPWGLGLPWSESIKKRACRYLLQRYLGQFLEEKLTLDQLTVDLYNGTGKVSEVRLDVQALNELGEQQNFPVEFVDGYISEMSVSIPWSALLSESSYVEVVGLMLTVQPKQRAENGASMFESMWSSMTSSMQLAEECLKQSAPDSKDTDQSPPLEGLELFAQAIDSILRRVKVKFIDTTIRIEHVPKDSTTGVAMEFRIKNVDYFDEAGTDPSLSDIASHHGQKVYHLAAFTVKKFCLEGITLYSDEFPSQARTFSRSVMSLSSSSTPESKNSDFGTAPVTPASQSPSSSHINQEPIINANLSLEPDPVLFGRLAGRQEIRVKLKQSEGVIGPKVDLEVNLGSLTTFLSPRQLHVLVELLHGLASPDLEDTSNVAPRSRCVEKPMDRSDFHRVEQELQHQLHPLSVLRTKGLQYAQGWSTASLDESDGEEFLPMHTNMNESILSDATSMEGSVSSVSSSSSNGNKVGLTTSFSNRLQGISQSQSAAFQPDVARRSKKKAHKEYGTNTLDSDPTAEVSHFHVRLSSLAMVLLHDDILTLSVESDGTTLARSSVQQMKAVAQEFFAELGLFAVTGYGNKDFEQAKEKFVKACQLNHIRLIGAPVTIEGNEKTTSHASSVGGTLTAASLEVLECLIDKKTPTQPANVEYVELLKFNRKKNGDESYVLGSQPDMKLHFKYLEKSVKHGHTRRYNQPLTDISITFQPCCSEIDISIVDRITALLNPQPLCRRNTKFTTTQKDAMSHQAYFHQVVENSTSSDSKIDLKASCSLLTIKLRFPTPDLRPIHDMDRPPWWKRSVRKDFLTFELQDGTFHCALNTQDLCRRYEIQCKSISGSFQEADTDNLVPFVHASADDKNGNSLPNGGEGFGWPRIVIQSYPECNRGELDEIPEMEGEESLPQSALETLETSGQKEPSPFSSKKVIHESDTPHDKSSNHAAEGEGEELLIPGDKQEMNEFIDYASRNCRIQLEVNLPCASMQLSSKHLYELIYNRINTDMFLWEPAAPKPKSTSPPEFYAGKGHSGIDFGSTMLQETTYPTFSLCKSGIQYDSDSDSEESEGVFYSVYEQRQRHRRKQQSETRLHKQSHMAVTLCVNQGVMSLFAPVRDSTGNVIPGQHGELQVIFDEGSMFSISGYKGKPGLGYVCLQVNHASFYHNGLVATPYEPQPLKLVGSPPSSHLEPTIYRTEPGAQPKSSVPVGSGCSNSVDMLAVAVKIQNDDHLHNLKTFRVAAGLRGATLRHHMCLSSHSWFTQLVDFFDVIDYPIAGYDPPGVITELHMHFWDCAVDYRPLHLPLKAVITVGSFSISSNIAAQTSTSTLRFIAEDAALFISDKISLRHSPVDLRKDYVCVVDLGLFELSLRLYDKVGEQNKGSPRIDLRASNNVLHIRTCADSGKALTDLLTYFASDGDLVSNEQSESQTTHNSDATTATTIAIDNNQNNAHNLSKSQVEHVHDMMEEAMKDTNGLHSNGKSRSPRQHKDGQGVEVFFFPDENHPLPMKPLHDSELCQTAEEDDDDNWEEEFCMLDQEAGSGIMPKNGVPEVRILTEEPIRVLDNHFSVPLGKTDQLRAPEHFPEAVLRYTLCEMTIIWHMYGGQDFGLPSKQQQQMKKQVKIEDNINYRTGYSSCPSSPPFTGYHFARSPSDTHIGGGTFVSFSKTSPAEVKFRASSVPLRSPQRSSKVAWQVRGGPGRQHDVLMELQLNKVRFRHEVYPDNAKEASRQILLVSEVEVRDRLASSQLNKFLYQYSSETRPKQSHANMIRVVAVHIRPDPKLAVQECCLKVTLLPLRLNIDQDSLLFLYNFFTEMSGLKKATEDGTQSQTPRHSTPTHQAPVMTVNVGRGSRTPSPEPQNLLILLEEDINLKGSCRTSPSHTSQKIQDRPPTPPIFFRSFVFQPDVPIRLDYQGKRVDMTHGPLAGLLMGLGHLNCSELRLRRLSYRHGLLGFDKLLQYVLNEWMQDIKKNQLPSLLSGVGPMHAVVQLIQGVRDLFWMPIEQYQKDGRIVRGLQRGANSFTTSTAMAALELTNRLVQAIQSTAEMAYDMVSPGPSVRHRKHSSRGRRRKYTQPADIREGMANAFMLVKEGLGETAQTIVRVASEEHEQKGVSGAVGGVLRQIPPTVVKPIILATEATSNVLGGMRSQLVPDARREAVEKWRSED